MLPHRRFGNRVLTVWVRWLARRRDLTDGQSGYRAFSPGRRPRAEIMHDYNYAQVLTLDLLAQGLRATPRCRSATRFRETGTSFVRLGRYLRKVVPAVHRELNASSTASRSPAAGGSVLDHVGGEPSRARPPRPARRTTVRDERVDRVVGHRDRVVGVVVHEQPEPAERGHVGQRGRPRRRSPRRWRR